MSVLLRVPPAASRRRGVLYSKLLAVAGFAALISGCAEAPSSPFGGPSPSDASAAVPRVGYRSTIGPYLRQRPVAPASWREQNERVAPAPKG